MGRPQKAKSMHIQSAFARGKLGPWRHREVTRQNTASSLPKSSTGVFSPNGRSNMESPRSPMHNARSPNSTPCHSGKCLRSVIVTTSPIAGIHTPKSKARTLGKNTQMPNPWKRHWKRLRRSMRTDKRHIHKRASAWRTNSPQKPKITSGI